jgi:hypothetical protein
MIKLIRRRGDVWAQAPAQAELRPACARASLLGQAMAESRTITVEEGSARDRSEVADSQSCSSSSSLSGGDRLLRSAREELHFCDA